MNADAVGNLLPITSVVGSAVIHFLGLCGVGEYKVPERPVK